MFYTVFHLHRSLVSDFDAVYNIFQGLCAVAKLCHFIVRERNIYLTADAAVADERVGAVFAALDSLGIPYIRFEHDATATMEDCAAVGKALEGTICKNLFLCNRQQTAFYLLTMPGDKPFHTKDLSAQIGSSRLSFAPPEKMEELLNTHPGSASVMGLLFDTEHRVQLVMDRDVYDAEYFCCHPCDNHGSLKIKTSDLLTKFLPHVGHEPIVVDLPRE